MSSISLPGEVAAMPEALASAHHVHEKNPRDESANVCEPRNAAPRHIRVTYRSDAAEKLKEEPVSQHHNRGNLKSSEKDENRHERQYTRMGKLHHVSTHDARDCAACS